MTEDEFFDAIEDVPLNRASSNYAELISGARSPVDKLLEHSTPQRDFKFSSGVSSFSSTSSTEPSEVIEASSDLKVATQAKDKEFLEFDSLVQVQAIKLEQLVGIGRVSPDGNLVALGGEDGFLVVYNIATTLEPLKRLRSFVRHRDTVKDIAWSPTSSQLLSASQDRTVILWAIDQPSPISIFSHPDFISSLDFHPGNPSFFVSGCYDKVLRLWSFPNSRTVFSSSFSDFITCTKYSPDGSILVVGLLHGMCEVFEGDITTELRHLATLNCRNRRGLNSRGKKVTGLEFSGDHSLLVSTNDSRMRLFSLNDFTQQLKFKGHSNDSNWTFGSFSNNSLHIISGSDNGQVYLWNTQPSSPTCKVSSYETFRPSRAKQVLVTSFWRETALRRLREAMFLQGYGLSQALFVVDSGAELRVFYNHTRN